MNLENLEWELKAQRWWESKVKKHLLFLNLFSDGFINTGYTAAKSIPVTARSKQ